MSLNNYVKLPGSGYGKRSLARVAGGTSRTYLGPDHLLVVERPAPGIENYRRLPFYNIETIIVAPTRSFYVNISVVGVLLIGPIFMLFSDSTAVNGFGIVFCLILGLFLIVELFKGPSARTIVRTSVQEIELGSCSRHRSARKTLELIESKILAAQAGSSAESAGSRPIDTDRDFDPEPDGR